jgi:hypothetical protein
MMALWAGLHNFGIEPVFEYLDFVTDFAGFEFKQVENTEAGFMRPGVMAALSRYVRDNPGVLRSGRTTEQILDEWIKSRS